MAHIIDKLVRYAQLQLDLVAEDVVYVRNRVLELLKLDSHEVTPCEDTSLRQLAVPDTLLEELRAFIAEHNIVSPSETDRLVGTVIGTLTPPPSAVNTRFWHLHQINPRQATDYLYNLQIKNDYIKKTFVDTNIHWVAPLGDNFLEITINMSKPEKRNEDIAKLVKAEPNGYPKCVLCYENVGYYGRDDHPNRTNLRTADDVERATVVFPILAVCVLRPPLHRHRQNPSADGRRSRHACLPIRLYRPVSALFHRIQFRFAARRRFDSQPRAFPRGRAFIAADARAAGL